jgi:dTDP-4-amino-4,6-dideoxygalactose transaminase
MLMLRNHGIDKTPQQRKSWGYDMKCLGRNYRITDFQCALGTSQLDHLDSFVKKRQRLAWWYKMLLSPLIGTIQEVEDAESSWHIFPILLPQGTNRDKVFNKMRQAGIGVNVHYLPVYKHTYYKTHYKVDEKEFPITELYKDYLLTLPLYPEMTITDVKRVVNTLCEAMK